MRPLSELLRLNKQIRVIGFDDAPFERKRGALVNVSGIVCANTRFEGMLWGESVKDGSDATEVLSQMLLGSKFHDQVNVVIIDGIAIGGFNIVDLPLLSESVGKPCIAVMRKRPDMAAIDRALKKVDDYDRRKALIEKAGVIHSKGHFHFQVAGCSPEIAAETLHKLTDTGHVPEALRLAHLIGAAVKTGQSSARA